MLTISRHKKRRHLQSEEEIDPEEVKTQQMQVEWDKKKRRQAYKRSLKQNNPEAEVSSDSELGPEPTPTPKKKTERFRYVFVPMI